MNRLTRLRICAGEKSDIETIVAGDRTRLPGARLNLPVCGYIHLCPNHEINPPIQLRLSKRIGISGGRALCMNSGDSKETEEGKRQNRQSH